MRCVCPHHLSSLATETIHCGLFLTAMSGVALNAIYVSLLSTIKATTVLQIKLNIIFYKTREFIIKASLSVHM